MKDIEIKQNILNRSFLVEYEGKKYFVDYLNSDVTCYSLYNRSDWEVYFNHEEVEDDDLRVKLIEFCREHFDEYNPKLR